MGPLRAWLLSVALVLAGVHLARADTGYIRELARNKARVIVAVSGPDAEPVARQLQDTIYRFVDWGKRRRDDIQVLSLDDAESQIGPIPEQVSVFLLLTGTDGKTALPPRLSRLSPLDPALLGSRLSTLRTLHVNEKPGSLVVRGALYAPDRARLLRLYDEFTRRIVGNFRELPFTTRHESNRLALVSTPELKPNLTGWGLLGGRVWDDIRWYSFDEAGRIDPTERARVYFVDRSTTPLAALPTEAHSVLESAPLGPATVAVARTRDEDPVVVLTAPTLRTLRRAIVRSPQLPALLAQPATRELLDLTRLAAAPVLVADAGQSDPERPDALQQHIVQLLRTEGLSLEPTSARERELAELLRQDAADPHVLLARNGGPRYLWLLRVAALGGQTRFRAEEHKLTPDLPPFTEEEPEKPRRRREETQRQFDERYEHWESRWRQWDQHRQEWQDTLRTARCEWERLLIAESAGRLSGTLELYDTQAPGGARALWSVPCRAEASEQQVQLQQRVTVRGHRNRPDSLEVPAPAATCPPAFLLELARRGLSEAVSRLQDDALLPEEHVVVRDEDTAASAILPLGKVAERVGELITLNRGERHGLKVGDRLELLLRYREIRDPDTGRVIRIKVEERLLVRVTEVDKEACEARLVSPAEAQKIGMVTVGTPFRRVE